MRIFNINIVTPHFKGIRQDRNTVEQLKKENQYDLNLPNQRKISNAIENLSNVPGETNVNFLLDVSENLKYGTNIDLGKASYNDWQVKLNNAARNALSKSPKEVQEKLSERLEQITTAPKKLNEDEKQILLLRNSLLKTIDHNQLEKIEDNNIKALDRNLDYFIISSEVPLSQKIYIMKRLNHLMSEEYKINPQLKDKKTQVLAEIINDITVNTPESKIPNIKSINQKSHGMCAAISICRKLLAYEDKPNFVDMVISELDSNDFMQIYDITKLGTGTKIPIKKTKIDFDYALEKGYRIIDTSALNWMQIGDSAGSINEQVGMYYSFDKDFFDTFHDSHLTADMNDPNIWAKQDYYRALLKAKQNIGAVKKQQQKQKQINTENSLNNSKKLKLSQKYTQTLYNTIKNISPELKNNQIQDIVSELQRLEVKNTARAEKIKDYKQNFIYLPNESDNAKIEKIKAFLSISLNQKNSEELEKQAPDILNLLDTLNSINNNSKTNYKASKINKAKNLYAAAAAYRIEHTFNLEIPEKCNDMLHKLNIIDRETRITKNIDMLVDKLEKNELNPIISETLAKNFETENDPEALITALRTNQETINYTMTELLDDFYAACLSGNRKNVLKNELLVLKDIIQNQHDNLTLKEIAAVLNIKDNRKIVLDKLNQYIEILDSENCTNEDYIKIYNKLGNKNQMMDFKDTYERLGKALFEDKNPQVIPGFNVLHGLAQDAPIEETFEVFNRIGQQFNNMSSLLTSFQQALEVRTADGEILNTVDSKEIILKKLENMQEIIPAKDLRKLQNRFTKIEKAQTNINGKAVLLKDLPSELITLSARENEVLKLISSKINSWYATTTRELDYQYRDIKNELEEHHRQIGVKTGQHWLGTEGSSGLANYQQVKIIEHMTDRPYYIESDTRTAIKKLKELPYSGISSTSVDHKSPAWHAQYIADIKPLTIKTPEGLQTKDALFHDNTWGPSEHENLWIDENNLSRTDYNNKFGGVLGYITDERYLNGNLLENLINQYGQQGNELNSYKYPMFYDVITPGKDPHSNSYVRQIRQNTLIHPTIYFEDLENIAKSKSKAEIKNIINKTKDIGKNIDKTFMDVQNKIIGKPPITSGIESKEDYDKLPDNDPVKILFEKIALLQSYNNIPDSKIFYKKTTIDELKSIKETIKEEARKNFNYAFGKNPDITKYLSESVTEKLSQKLDEFAKSNNIKITPTTKIQMIGALNKIDKDKFDGSSETTISLMVESFEKFVTKHSSNFPNKKEKIQDLADTVRENLRTNLGFTLADLKSSSSENRHIINWIDDNFKPETDEEFVQIFNKLQNMTTKEFEEKFNSKISNEAIGIKNISGYDLIKRFRGYEERIQNSVYNMLFYEQFGYNIQMSETTPSYEYNKLNKVIRGAYYKNQRTFDDLYLDYYYSLKSLSIQKDYNRIKDMAFRQYGLFPAYPKMDTQDPEEVQKLLTSLYNDISESIETIDTFRTQDKTINIINDLHKAGNKLKDSIIPTKKQKEYIADKICEFLELNSEDDSIKTTIDAAEQILLLDDNATGQEYKKLIKTIYDEINLYSTTADGKTMVDAIKNSAQEIKLTKQNFIMNIIDPQYQQKAYQILEKWINAKIKKNPNADNYFEEFEKLYNKHMLVKSPEKMLDEYLLLLAQDANQSLTEKQKEQIEGVKSTYKINVQALLMNANILELQNILMNCAGDATLNVVRDEFKNSKMILPNGMVVNMDSDFAISTMLAPLLADSDLDTAVIFIEQLGLSERVIDIALKNANFKEAYHSIKRIDNIFTAVSKQTAIIEKELKQLENLDKDADYINTLNTAKENIIKKFKNTNYRATIKIIDETFKKAIESMQQHPEHSKLAYLYLYLGHAKTASIYIAKQNVEKLNYNLQIFQRKIDLIKRLKLPKDSPAEIQREKYLAEVEKLENFAAAHTKRYDNLNLATGSHDI